MSQKKTTIARWESKSGKWWVVLVEYNDARDDQVGSYGYTANGSGGLFLSDSREDAIADIERKVALGYFQPDAAKTPMQRVQ